MKIGIIVYSQTGNTFSVASKLYEELKKTSNKVSLMRVEATRDLKQNVLELTKEPKINQYDVIIFASFVEAFTLCPVMKNYLENIETMKGKKVFSFVTQFLPYKWLGGTRAVNQMKNICEQKDATIIESGVINWKNKRREDRINDLIDMIVSKIEGTK